MAKTPKATPISENDKKAQILKYCKDDPRWRAVQEEQKHAQDERDKLAVRCVELLDKLCALYEERIRIEWAADRALQKTNYKLPRKRKA